tara:strand:+ start:62 stop:388 length:327 start_codon:yes stop_codon:yes gene_type:complete
MSEQESNPVTSGQGNFNPQGPFTDTSDANKALLGDIEKITASQAPTLPDHLLKSAKQAGELASNAKTLEDKQNIYKSYLSKSNQGNQSTTKSQVKDWENAAEFFRNKK